MRGHGATWNGFPLRVGKQTLGDHGMDGDTQWEEWAAAADVRLPTHIDE